jgi:hypothetical protein
MNTHKKRRLPGKKKKKEKKKKKKEKKKEKKKKRNQPRFMNEEDRIRGMYPTIRRSKGLNVTHLIYIRLIT